ncbi:uncharacterized protein LOC144629229 [Oculina patagonica]
MARFVRRSLLSSALVCFTFLCIGVVVAKDCESSQKDKTLKKSNCTGYEIAVHTVWTEFQCLDNCIRHPYCLKYIFYGKGSQNCKLLNTGNIDNVPGAKNMPKITGACAPDNVKTIQETLLGTKGCPELQTDTGTDIENEPYRSGRK